MKTQENFAQVCFGLWLIFPFFIWLKFLTNYSKKICGNLFDIEKYVSNFSIRLIKLVNNYFKSLKINYYFKNLINGPTKFNNTNGY